MILFPQRVRGMKFDPNIKVDVCFCSGILFSTLVFGPACGFILGSVCTKYYVDEIFIDDSEYNNFSKCFSEFLVYWPVLASQQGSWASLQTTHGGSGPGGQASSCVVPYSFSQLSWCLASLSRCQPGRERRGLTANRLCFLPLWIKTMMLLNPAMGL